VCVDSHQAYGASHTAMAGSVSILHSLFASRCILGGARVSYFYLRVIMFLCDPGVFLEGTIVRSNGKIQMR
jgi:hypothetical protein